MDNNDRIFLKDLGNRLMLEFEEILNLYEALLTESQKDYRTYGADSREAGKRKYELMHQIQELTPPLKQDYLFFSEQLCFLPGRTEWELPFNEQFEAVDINVDSMVMDRFFGSTMESIYRDIRKASEVAKNAFFGNLVRFFYACPCCTNYMFVQNGDYEICPICKWENDKVQNTDPRFKGGANKECLIDYRVQFRSRRTRL